MSESFSATIKFALLVLAMLFTANLYAAGKLAGVSCIWGVALAILAAGLAYGAQHCFTRAEDWYKQHMHRRANPGTAFDPDDWENYQGYDAVGRALQLGSVGGAVLSGICFLFGAL